MPPYSLTQSYKNYATFTSTMKKVLILPKMQRMAPLLSYFHVVDGEFLDTALIGSAGSDREGAIFVINVKASAEHDAPAVISGDGAVMEISQLISKLYAITSQVVLNIIESVNKLGAFLLIFLPGIETDFKPLNRTCLNQHGDELDKIAELFGIS